MRSSSANGSWLRGNETANERGSAARHTGRSTKPEVEEQTRMRMIIRGFIIAAVGMFGLAFAASAFARTHVNFQLNWYAGGANAGFAAALEEGYYRDAGLDVTI